MLVYPQICAQEFAEPKQAAKLTGTDGYIARVGSWLRASF
jgi:cell division protein FtsA